jgi:flavin-dependent dehydrogenase
MMKDVAIIGGSAAGFFTACLLAREGVNVRVFEAEDPLNPSPRTLIVTSYMPNLIGSLGEEAIVNTIQRFELFADGRVATISLKKPDLVIERSKLIQRLAVRAEASGTKVLGGHRFLCLKPNGERLTFTLLHNGDRNEIEESADVLIGADGAFSKVAQSAGWSKQPTVPLFQAVVELPKDMPSDTIRVWFAPEETPYFYWLIPHSPRKGVLGLISEEEREGFHFLKSFIDRKGLVPIKFQSARTPFYTRWIPFHRKIQKSHVYLVGDAAGHVKVTTMGGIVSGFRGAKGVAEAILNGGSNNELRALRRELGRHMLMRRVFNSFTQKDYIGLLDILNPAAKRLLSVVTRDETDKLLRNLLLRKPRFFLLGLRSFLR